MYETCEAMFELVILLRNKLPHIEYEMKGGHGAKFVSDILRFDCGIVDTDLVISRLEIDLEKTEEVPGMFEFLIDSVSKVFFGKLHLSRIVIVPGFAVQNSGANLPEIFIRHHFKRESEGFCYKNPAGNIHTFMKRQICDIGRPVFVALLLVLAFFLTSTVAIVSGDSMENTLRPNDRIYVVRTDVMNLFGGIKDGQIIAFKTAVSDTPFIKRVIATGGQRVDINFATHTVTVDGNRLEEPYIKELTAETGDMRFPLTVPKGHVFAMGDNRNDSLDSRFRAVGLIGESDIIGVASFRVYPFFPQKFNIYNVSK